MGKTLRDYGCGLTAETRNHTRRATAVHMSSRGYTRDTPHGEWRDTLIEQNPTVAWHDAAYLEYTNNAAGLRRWP